VNVRFGRGGGGLHLLHGDLHLGPAICCKFRRGGLDLVSRFPPCLELRGGDFIECRLLQVQLLAEVFDKFPGVGLE
jgi:hypothetical protein